MKINPSYLANSSSSQIHSFVSPIIKSFSVLATLVCVLFLINAAYHYITSSGQPEKLAHAKQVIRNALFGLLLVLSAATITIVLSHAYNSSGQVQATSLPRLKAITPNHVSNGLVNIMIKAVTGLLNNIIQSVAAPFLKALSYFTNATPLMSANPSVYNLWLVLVGIADSLLTIVIALIGFHIMSAATFGLEEIEIKHLLPRLGLIFLLINSSIYLIDGVIEMSNAIIDVIKAAGPSTSVWNTLTSVVKNTSGAGVAALLLMVAFIIFAIMLLVFYISRIVILYIGAILAPIVVLLWLVPGFRDFSETAGKVYLSSIFVLLVHVVILQLAASLLSGVVVIGSGQTADGLMAIVVGLATMVTLLKTQASLTQLSFASSGQQSTRKLGSQFMSGISYVGDRQRNVNQPANLVNRQKLSYARSNPNLILNKLPIKSNVGAIKAPGDNTKSNSSTNKLSKPKTVAKNTVTPMSIKVSGAQV